MEILAELLFGLVGFIFEFLGEFVLQFVLEALFELGVHAFRRQGGAARREPLSPLLAAVCYVFAGAVAGFVSLLVMPAPFITSFFGRVANLLLMPFAAGTAMSLMGAWRRRRGEDIVRIDRFWYGFAFAFAMALVRFMYAQGMTLPGF